jgi:hypothetical protein
MPYSRGDVVLVENGAHNLSVVSPVFLFRFNEYVRTND